MTTTTFILMRHGQTSMNIERKISGGQSNPSLTAKGEVEAEELGLLLKRRHSDIFKKVYSSDLDRSYQTAVIAFKGQEVKIKKKHNFREIDHGKSEGMLGTDRNEMWKAFIAEKMGKEEVSSDPYMKWNVHPIDDAETSMQLYDRITKEMIRIAKKHPGEKIALSVHNAVIQIPMMKQKCDTGEIPMDERGLFPLYFESEVLPNCTVATFVCDPDKEEIQFIGLS